MEIAGLPVQDQRRQLWSKHFSLKPTRPPVMVSIGFHNKWCADYFGDAAMKCESPELRGYERTLRMALFQHTVGDDTILEPWLTVPAACGDAWSKLWGIESRKIPSDTKDGAWKCDPALVNYDDVARLQVPHHFVDEAETQRTVDLLLEVFGDTIPLNVHRGPRCLAFSGDLITILCMLRGLEQVMLDMSENPNELHRVMAFMRDGVLTNNKEAEAAGDFTLSSHCNQAMPYSDELEWPAANSGPRKQSDLWAFSAAQEMTLVSPGQHDKFVLQYQIPIVSRFGLVHYGCCENLTRKIGHVAPGSKSQVHRSHAHCGCGRMRRTDQGRICLLLAPKPNRYGVFQL